MRDQAVILGSTGFAGAALMRALGRRGDAEAKGCGSAALDLTSPEAPGRLGGMLNGETVLISAVRPRPGADPVESFSRDIAISTNPAACLFKRRIRKLVHFSTVSVYDDEATNLAVTEETPVAPASLCGVARLAGHGWPNWAGRSAGGSLIRFAAWPPRPMPPRR